MRSIRFGTLAAMIFAGCALPPCFYSCPLVDPAQCGCGPRVPYCTSPPGCGAFGAAYDLGPPINGYPPNGGVAWGQPAVPPGGCMGGLPVGAAPPSGVGNFVASQPTDLPITPSY
jgi:hypothetical protein